MRERTQIILEGPDSAAILKEVKQVLNGEYAEQSVQEFAREIRIDVSALSEQETNTLHRQMLRIVSATSVKSVREIQ